jgi:hypothetical protein
MALRHRADVRGLAIEADHAMAPELGDRARRPVAREVARMREHAERHAADPLHHQGRLRGPSHPDRDVGRAMEEILDGIRGRQLEREGGVQILERGEDRRQQLDGDHLARADPHRAGDLVTLPRGGA